jgi:hypothetical protein
MVNKLLLILKGRGPDKQQRKPRADKGIKRATSLKEYHEREAARLKLTRENASRRFKGLEQLPVPEKLDRPLVPIAYDKAGNYIGRLLGHEVIDPNWVIVHEEEK